MPFVIVINLTSFVSRALLEELFLISLTVQIQLNAMYVLRCRVLTGLGGTALGPVRRCDINPIIGALKFLVGASRAPSCDGITADGPGEGAAARKRGAD
ncbi:hypothetical protein EVAR_269_1 [Eumeta japonica]|uniref:Uncharacterized protein n=1 Tax=Eumeta variegata TaxID=151549 RepID=A0A4C1S9F8_EUMVA|nr:hypothetical protein EVAR_269_1 [Eumeta japonica]